VVVGTPTLGVMATSGARTRKNFNGDRTMAKLLEFARLELARSGPLDFSLDTVLRESGVARSSFYHHFGDRSSIIAICQIAELKDSLRAENEVLRLLVEKSSSGEQLFELLAMRIRMNGEEEQVRRRRQRVEMLVLANGNHQLRERLAEAQARGTDYLVATLDIAQGRGLIDPVAPVREIAQAMQSMFIGRVFVDVLEDEEQSRFINEGTITALRLLVRPQT